MRISDVMQDAENLNLGSEQGAKLLDKSLSEVGFARSLVMSADGQLLCGNQTQKAAVRQNGDVEPIIVESDGTRPVIVRRTDVMAGSQKALKIAVYDNLANEKGLVWRQDTSEVIQEHGLSVEELGFTQEDIQAIETPSFPPSQNQPNVPAIGSSISVVAECRDEDHAKDLFERLKGEGFPCRILTI